MNGSIFSMTRYMIGVDFRNLGHTPVPQLPLSYPPPPPPRNKVYVRSFVRKILSFDLQQQASLFTAFAVVAPHLGKSVGGGLYEHNGLWTKAITRTNTILAYPWQIIIAMDNPID